MNDKLETQFMKIRIEKNILHCIFADKLDIDLEVARHCVSTRIAFSKGVSYCCLIDMKGVRSATKEAREYLGAEGSRLITAGAMIIHNPVTKMLVNIFLLINKPKSPAKFFTHEEEVRKWLQQYLNRIEK